MQLLLLAMLVAGACYRLDPRAAREPEPPCVGGGPSPFPGCRPSVPVTSRAPVVPAIVLKPYLTRTVQPARRRYTRGKNRPVCDM